MKVIAICDLVLSAAHFNQQLHGHLTFPRRDMSFLENNDFMDHLYYLYHYHDNYHAVY